MPVGEGIDAGDAVVSFLADTTQLDVAFAKLDSTPARLAGANTAVEQLGEEFAVSARGAVRLGEVTNLAGQQVKASMNEARGELALLGDETGIKMPRHLRSFVAELPGVGEALTAAFSATAVLFLLQILVTATQRFSEFAAGLIYGSQATKEQEESAKELNKVLIPLAEQYIKLKKEIDAYGKSALQLAQQNEKEAKQSVADLTASLLLQEAAVNKLNNQTVETKSRYQLLGVAYDQVRSGAMSVTEAFLELSNGTLQQTILDKEQDTGKKNLIATYGKQRVAQEESTVAVHKTGEEAEKVAEKERKLAKEFEKIIEAVDKATNKYRDFSREEAKLGLPLPGMTDQLAHLYLLQAALKDLGADTTDLVAAQTKATASMTTVTTAWRNGEITTRQYGLAMVSLLTTEKQLDEAMGKDTAALDKQIAAYQRLGVAVQKDHTFMDAFTKDFKQKAKETEKASQDMGKMLGQTVGEMNTAFASAIMGAITSGASIGAALEQATKAILAQLATQALSKSMYYLAEGIAATATGNPAAAGFFAASGEFAAVAGLSGAAAAVMGGGGSGSGAPQTMGINTNSGGMTSQVGGPVRNVQKFAEGGLISGPTLAILGEGGAGSVSRPTEVVLPLDNQRVMDKVRDGMGGTGSSDTHIHFHKGAGLISPDTLGKVVDQISAGVKKRTLTLHSTNSFRIQKRST